MKVIFMGTPDFAVETLKVCIDYHEVIGVFTQPDKPKGRGKKLAPPAVKVVAEAAGIPVYQPKKVKEAEWVETLKSLEPDVIVVVAYGQLLSKAILDIPKFGCVNVHASLLPRHRGAAPINWAIAEGDAETGVTTMLMDPGLDTGDMLLKTKVTIDSTMTAGELHDILAVKGAELLKETLDKMAAGTLVPEPQDNALSTYAPMLSKDIAEIDWSMPAEKIERRVRGFNPWPVAHTAYEGSAMKVFRAEVIATIGGMDSSETAPGTVVAVERDGFVVKTGDGFLKILELQWGSQKRMAADAFLRGHQVVPGTILEQKEEA
ncbi:MAG: methionyl-tRNA formyltransferase [Clostridiales bacterium]|nr:methionyl-tRNA formyltransferase [Clostridiales bacterium]